MIALTTSSERRSTIKCGLIGINETFSPRRRVLGFETQEFGLFNLVQTIRFVRLIGSIVDLNSLWMV